MSSRLPLIKQVAYKIFIFTTAATIILTVFLIFIRIPGINNYQRALFGDMIYGNSYKPFVYRSLLPTAVRIITGAIPRSTRESINRYGEYLLNKPYPLGINEGIDETNLSTWEQRFLTEYLVASILMIASLFGFYSSLKYLLVGVFSAPEWFMDGISLVAVACLPAFFRHSNYIYDFSTLFLFTFGLGLMVRLKWRFFIVVFLIASFNKETTILLSMIFVVYLFRRWDIIERTLFNRLLLIQVIGSLIIRAAIVWTFRENRGTSIEFHLFDSNLEFLLRPFSITTIVTGLSLAILVYFKWSEKPVFLKRGLIILVPLMISTLLFGLLDELRASYEVYPILASLVAHSVGKILDVDIISLPEAG
jgi:hypothetical protein